MLLVRPGASITNGTEYVYIPALGYWRKSEVRHILNHANYRDHGHFFSGKTLWCMATFAKSEDRNFGVAFTVVGTPRFGPLSANSYSLIKLIGLCKFDLAVEMTNLCIRSVSDVDSYTDDISVNSAEKLFPLIKPRLDKFLLDTIDVDIEYDTLLDQPRRGQDLREVAARADELAYQAADYMNQVAHDRTAIEPWRRHEHFVPNECGELSQVLRYKD